jgi:hypothetical protein
MSFLGSLFGGQNTTLSQDMAQFGKIGQQQTGQGQNYENQAGTFWSDLLSGNASKQAQALAPQISAAKTRTSQDQKTNTMMGGRSGGTAAANASAQDKLHSDLTNLIGSLTNSSASGLENLGTNMVSTGLGSLKDQEEASQTQMQNWSNSILGKGITTGVSAAETFALGA